VIAAAVVNTDTQAPRIVHHSQRCERGTKVGLSTFVVIGRFSPVWIASEVAVNDCDARRVATGLADSIVDVAADGIVIAGGKVRIVGVQTLHSTR
jgi:hypothetical protein